MGDASPYQIAHVQQSIHAAKINEYAVIGDIFHSPSNDSAFRERRPEFFSLCFLLVLKNRAPAHNHISALAVKLQYANFGLAVFPRIEIVFDCIDKPGLSPPSPVSDDKYAKLAKLKQLLDSGAITQEEFNQEKAKVLAQP